MAFVHKVFVENPWFHALPKAEADALLAVAKPLKLACGETLYNQGDQADQRAGGFFGLISGVVKISFLHADGSEAILTFIEPGNWFGEVSTLAQLPRPQMAMAQQDCELLCVSQEDFSKLMMRPGFANAIARLLAQRLCMVYSLMEDATLNSKRQRICRRLLMLAHGDSSQTKQARKVISASQESIANMLGISRPTLNKELQILAQSGALELHYGYIEILDMRQLESMD